MTYSPPHDQLFPSSSPVSVSQGNRPQDALSDDSALTSNVLPSEGYVRKTMPRILGPVDMTATFVVSIFLATTATTAAAGGPAAITYLLLGGILFFLPSLIATAQLGVLYPNEGSLYNWTHKAIGGFMSFFAGFCAWFPSVLISTSFAGLLVTYLTNLNSAWLAEPWQQGFVIILVLLFCCAFSVQRFRVVQNVINALVVLAIVASLLLLLSATIWLLRGHASATGFTSISDWQVSPANLVLFGFMAFAYIGAEGALNLAGELKEGQEATIVKRHLLFGPLLIAIMYLINTFAVLIVLGPEKGAIPFALVSVVDLVLGKSIGDIAAICFMGSFLATALVYNYVFARLLMVAAIDMRIPIDLGRLNRNRAPANAIVFQTVISVIYILISYMVIPNITFLSISSADLSLDFYTVSQAASALIWAVSTCFLYIGLVGCYRRARARFEQRRIFPLPVLWLSVIIGIATCVLTIVDTLLFSWLPQISNQHWWWIVGGVASIFLVFAAAGAMLANSEATWEQFRH